MPETQTLILEHQKIEQKINRIAYQIYEDNYDQEKIIMAGIASNGFLLAQLLKEKIESISPIKITLEELRIDKKNPINSQIELNISEEEIENQIVIVVDGVLNSGRTMMYGLQHFMKKPLQKLAIAVLLDRSHKRFPVHADYVGTSLATTLQEHIEVSSEKKKYTAHLV